MSGDGRTTQVRIGGEAGQGVILAGVILAQAAMNDRRQVAQSARYGAAMRGGDATVDVVVSDEPIDYPHVEAADFLVVMSQPTYESLVPKRGDGALVCYDPFFVTPKDGFAERQVPIEATETAIRKFGKATAANLVVLGFLVCASGVVSWASLVAAVEAEAPPKFRAANLEAIGLGRELAAKAGLEVR
jgi:2-oxoglutarate ferredoxin oxidoreductase subunit gamma